MLLVLVLSLTTLAQAIFFGGGGGGGCCPVQCPAPSPCPVCIQNACPPPPTAYCPQVQPVYVPSCGGGGGGSCGGGGFGGGGFGGGGSGFGGGGSYATPPQSGFAGGDSGGGSYASAGGYGGSGGGGYAQGGSGGGGYGGGPSGGYGGGPGGGSYAGPPIGAGGGGGGGESGPPIGGGGGGGPIGGGGGGGGHMGGGGGGGEYSPPVGGGGGESGPVGGGGGEHQQQIQPSPPDSGDEGQEGPVGGGSQNSYVPNLYAKLRSDLPPCQPAKVKYVVLRSKKHAQKGDEMEITEIDPPVEATASPIEASQIGDDISRNLAIEDAVYGDTKCNSKALRQLIMDNVVREDALATKRNIHESSLKRFPDSTVDVICSGTGFTYLVSTTEHCEAQKDNVICFVYKRPLLRH